MRRTHSTRTQTPRPPESLITGILVRRLFGKLSANFQPFVGFRSFLSGDTVSQKTTSKYVELQTPTGGGARRTVQT